jgi:hypothetical protein
MENDPYDSEKISKELEVKKQKQSRDNTGNHSISEKGRSFEISKQGFRVCNHRFTMLKRFCSDSVTILQ